MGTNLFLISGEQEEIFDEPFERLIEAAADFVVAAYLGTRGQVAKATLALYAVQHDHELRKHVKMLVWGLRVLNLAQEDVVPVLQRLTAIFISESARAYQRNHGFEKEQTGT